MPSPTVAAPRSAGRISRPPPPTPQNRLPVEDTDTIVLATVEDITGDTIFLTRSFAPPDLSLNVEYPKSKWDKLQMAVGNVMDHTVGGRHDLVSLEDVSDATILHNLRLRQNKQIIFTAIGPVLVVVNPYEPVPICGPDHLKELSKGVRRLPTPPFPGSSRIS